MPRTPDASTVTTVRRVAATITTDPTKKSRTFVAPVKQGFLSAQLRSTEEARSMIQSGSVLRIPLWTSPATKGRIFLL